MRSVIGIDRHSTLFHMKRRWSELTAPTAAMTSTAAGDEVVPAAFEAVESKSFSIAFKDDGDMSWRFFSWLESRRLEDRLRLSVQLRYLSRMGKQLHGRAERCWLQQ